MTAQKPNTTANVDVAAEIDALQLRLQSLAEAGDWSGFATAMQRRDELLPKVAADDRAVVFTAAVSANERMLKLLRAQRQDVADQLLKIRRGRDIVSQYASQHAAPYGTR